MVKKKKNKFKKKLNLNKRRILIGVIFLLVIVLFSVAFYLQEKTFCGSSYAGERFSPDACDNSCNNADDCKFVCGCGAINKNEDCFTKGVQISCKEPSKIDCVEGKCVALDEEDICENQGGEWILFNNGCVDSCQYNRNKSDVMCTQALTMGCNCGKDKCWNQEEKVCEEI